MRKGENIVRNKKIELHSCSHRVIIPLYIPNEKGYYKDAFSIFKLCLESVQKTANSPLKISVVANGCSDSINKKLVHLFKNHAIDELIIEKEAIGKINSILKAVRTAEERLITITDADVLFLNNWEVEVLKVFNAFPQAGMVSPVPMYRTHYRHTSNIWLRYLLSEKLKFRRVKNPEALTKFAKSIGWSYLNDKVKDVIASIQAKNGTIAVIGNSHFVGTYKNEVFKALPKTSSKYKLGGTSEELYTDLPVLKMGGFRLATNDNFAYHLGNTIEQWMNEEFNAIEEEVKIYQDFNNLKVLKKNSLKYFLTCKVFKKIISNSTIKQILFKRKGLNSRQLKTFMNGEY